MNFGEKLRHYRNKAGLSQAALGKMVGLQQQRIAGYENGDRTPRFRIRSELAEALKLVDDQLMEGSISDCVPIDICTLRESLGISADELGRNLSIPLTGKMIEEYESGRDLPTLRELTSIVEYFITKLNGSEQNEDVKQMIAELEGYIKIKESLEEGYRELDILQEIAEYFNMLNDEGKAEAIKRLEELTQIPKYQKKA